MTNYNDGKWHGWQCDYENPPVHPETEVEVTNGGGLHKQRSKNTNWGAVIAFRVIKEHKEPREFWIVGGQAYENIIGAAQNQRPGEQIIHVREVLE